VGSVVSTGEKEGEHEQKLDKPAFTVERDGFNLHAGVRIEAGDDLGRERLARYGARPPLSLERLHRLPGGRVAYRLKYVSRGRGKHRVMSAMEFMARLSAIIAPPRYPLVRYGGVLASRSAWRREIVPRPRERPPIGDNAPCAPRDAGTRAQHTEAMAHLAPGVRSEQRARTVEAQRPTEGRCLNDRARAARPRTSRRRHRAHPKRACRAPLGAFAMRRPLRGLAARRLGDAAPQSAWVDALQCPKCTGRLRVIAVITEREPVRRILAHLGLPSELPPLARARDPTVDPDDAEPPGQLGLGLA
jgi:putative transposase